MSRISLSHSDQQIQFQGSHGDLARTHLWKMQPLKLCSPRGWKWKSKGRLSCCPLLPWRPAVPVSCRRSWLSVSIITTWHEAKDSPQWTVSRKAALVWQTQTILQTLECKVLLFHFEGLLASPVTDIPTYAQQGSIYFLSSLLSLENQHAPGPRVSWETLTQTQTVRWGRHSKHMFINISRAPTVVQGHLPGLGLVSLQGSVISPDFWISTLWEPTEGDQFHHD